MPSTDTVTSTQFTSFTSGTRIKSAEVNANFNIWRGHNLPIDASTSAAVNQTYDLGSTTYRWRYAYAQYLNLSGHTTTASLTLRSDPNLTVGGFIFEIASTTVFKVNARGVNGSYVDISSVTAETVPAISDEVLIYDASAVANRKMTLENIFKTTNVMTAETAVVMSTDLVPIYDASAAAPRKMSVDNLVGGVRPFIYANRNSAQTIASSTWTKCTLDSEISDTNSNFASDRFTCTIPGVYLILGCVHFASGVDTAIVGAAIRKDGSGIAQTFLHQSVNKQASAFVAHITSYSATQYAELWAYQDTGGYVTIGNNGENTWFCVMRLI